MALSVVCKRTSSTGNTIKNLKSIYEKSPLFMSCRYMSASAHEFTDVVHDAKKKEFVIALGKTKARLQYENIGNKTIDLWHTEVPESLRGKGLAKILAEAAFDHVVKEDLKMIVSCTYLKKYLEENPRHEYSSRELK